MCLDPVIMAGQGLISLRAGGLERLMQASVSSNSAMYDDDDIWTPLHTLDYLHLGEVLTPVPLAAHTP